MNVPVRQNSALAIVSLVSGILGWTILPLVGSIVAVITGHMARKEIRLNPALDGDVMAVIGLVLGWVAIVGAIVGVVVFLMLFGGIAWLSTR
ncbi:MAG: DUF4190 domain-containing protein [Lysobacteraceae bacterium]|nr:MAG: DUF4190 domain-containing protein [Xanthomonadaceae bacterium]